ncbi:MAG: DUF1292 domain-containing protein [Syntrophomonadaceae bacterium]|nr:DUF1292 domain-containing protein [Syntrophomonadaceae bacterium]
MAKDDFKDDLELEEDEFEVLVLVDDNGQEHYFHLIADLDIDGKTYVIVAPLEAGDSDEEEVEISILKATFDDEGNMFLADIEDDEEWEKVADAWQDLVEGENEED